MDQDVRFSFRIQMNLVSAVSHTLVNTRDAERTAVKTLMALKTKGSKCPIPCPIC